MSYSPETEVTVGRLVRMYGYAEDEIRKLCPTDKDVAQLYEAAKNTHAHNDDASFSEKDDFELDTMEKERLKKKKLLKTTAAAAAAQADLPPDKQVGTKELKSVGSILNELAEMDDAELDALAAGDTSDSED